MRFKHTTHLCIYYKANNMRHANKNKRGITLIETVIYIALFSMLMTTVVLSSWQIIEAQYRDMHAHAAQEEATFVLRKLNWAFAGATKVNVTDVQTVVIIKPELALTFSVEHDALMLTRDAGTPAALTQFPVTDVVFAASENMLTFTFRLNNKPFTFTTAIP